MLKKANKKIQSFHTPYTKIAYFSIDDLWRGLVDDFRTIDWVEVRENLRFAAGKLKYLRDIIEE